MWPFTFRKDAFHVPKGVLLGHERRPFAQGPDGVQAVGAYSFMFFTKSAQTYKLLPKRVKSLQYKSSPTVKCVM